jgi:hypothetical protein
VRVLHLVPKLQLGNQGARRHSTPVPKPELGNQEKPELGNQEKVEGVWGWYLVLSAVIRTG